jgi:uncharacterized DUF497 family protein
VYTKRWTSTGTRAASQNAPNACPILEIEEVLRDSRTIVVGDPYEGEQRFRAIGRNAQGRGIFIVFTPRIIDGWIYLRPIGARYIHNGKSK